MNSSSSLISILKLMTSLMVFIVFVKTLVVANICMHLMFTKIGLKKKMVLEQDTLLALQL